MLLLKARLLAALKTEQLMEITLEYWNALAKQIKDAIEVKDKGDLDFLLKGSNTWTID